MVSLAQFTLASRHIIGAFRSYPSLRQPLQHIYNRGFAMGAAMAVARRSSRLSATETDPAPPNIETMPPPPATSNPRKRKAPAASTKPTATKKEKEAPSTPKKKRVKAEVPQLTPTPSAVGIISEAASKPKSKPIERLANPNYTNATLLSPETSRVIKSELPEPQSPTKPARAKVAKSKTTTQTLLQEACDYLISVDERMRPIVEKHHCAVFSPEGLAEKVDPFESISSGIISQQVSGAAAKSIKAKFVALFDKSASTSGNPSDNGGRFPHPSEVVGCTIEKLRTAGLSQRKAEYIQGLAEKFVSGELTAQFLQDAPYEEVFDKLIAVRGLGKWSVEMFACFGLKRMDVFSTGDLGVQRGMAAFEGRDVAKLKGKGGKWKYMSEQDMIDMSDKFAPYRSLFMWYMWRVEETDVSTME